MTTINESNYTSYLSYYRLNDMMSALSSTTASTATTSTATANGSTTSSVFAGTKNMSAWASYYGLDLSSLTQTTAATTTATGTAQAGGVNSYGFKRLYDVNNATPTPNAAAIEAVKTKFVNLDVTDADLTKIASLDPLMQDKLVLLYKACNEKGIKFSIASAYRSEEYQANLYQKHLNGTLGLAAPPGQSKHNYGLAIDFTPLNGATYADVIKIAKSADINLKSLDYANDACHLEYKS